MSQQYDDTNRGALFKNDKGDNPKKPDYTGKINVEGKEFYLSAWIKEGRTGKFMSLSIQEPRQKEPEQHRSSRAAMNAQRPSDFDYDPDSDFPF